MRKEFPPYISYLIVTLMSVALLAMQATIPFKIKALGGDLGAVGLLFMWTSAWYVAAGFGLGWVSHHFGPRRVMLVTLTLCAALALAMSGATALWHIYVLLTLYAMALCVFWAATEHASTGLHAHLSLVQSTAIFCVAFSVGNAIGMMSSAVLQGRSLALPFLVSAALTVVVLVLTWVTVSPQAGFQNSTPQDIASFPEAAKTRVRRSLLASRTGMVGVYGTYALVMVFLPRFLWEYRNCSKPFAGAMASLTLATMAITFALHGKRSGWMHRLTPVWLSPPVAATGLLVAGLSANPVLIALGTIVVGIAAGTAYTHNLYYSLEEPGQRARRAGVHEALVGAAFTIPPALGGLAARWTNSPTSIFWMGAFVAVLAAVAQQVARIRRRDVLE